MFSVPNVTMNAGSLMALTSRPLTTPNSIVTPTPHAIANGAGTPLSAASFVITTPPSAMTAPQDKSTPAVKTMSV